METRFTRRQLLSGSLVAGVATLVGPTAMMGCAKDAPVTAPTQIPRDVASLLRTLALDESYLIADPRTGRLYRLDQSAHTVSQLDASGTVRWTFGAGADPSSKLNFPTDVAPRPDGSLWVIDAGDDRIVQLSADGSFVRAVDGLRAPRSAVIDADGGLWVIDTGSHQIKGFTPGGEAGRTIGEAGQGATQINGPRGLALDAAGNLHVVDSGNARVQVFARSGAFVRSYGAYGTAAGQFKNPRSIAVTANGLSYVSDPTAGTVEIFEPSGASLARLAGLTVSGRPAVPLDVSLSASGLVQVRLYSWTTA